MENNNFDYMERLAKEYDKQIKSTEKSNNVFDDIVYILEEQIALIDSLAKMAKRKNNILTYLRNTKYEALRLSYKNQTKINDKPIFNMYYNCVERIKERLIDLQMELFKFTDTLEGADAERIEKIENRNLSLLIYVQ